MSKANLEQIQSLAAFSQILHEDRSRLWHPNGFFAARNYSWLRDASDALSFALATRAKRVRLIADDRPDFEVQYANGHRLSFETTLADFEGRKMGDEHKAAWDLDNYVKQVSQEDLWQRRLAIPHALYAAISRKVIKARKRPYPPRTNLLVHINLGTHGFWRDEIEKDLACRGCEAMLHFNSVWVLWSGRLYRIAPQPFLGRGDVFRPKAHELGRALRLCAEKRALYSALEPL